MNTKHTPATVQPLDAIPQSAASTGIKMARKLFAKRGNHSEAHVTENELAVMLAAAFHLGTTHRDDAYPRLVSALRDLAAGEVYDEKSFEATVTRSAVESAGALLRELGE